jgi:hypothetical protein
MFLVLAIGEVVVTAAGDPCRRAIFSQTLEEAMLRATGDRDGQTQKLRGGKETGDAERGA